MRKAAAGSVVTCWGSSYCCHGGVLRRRICAGVSVSSEQECQAEGADELDARRKMAETAVGPREHCCKYNRKKEITGEHEISVLHVHHSLVPSHFDPSC